jgi:hypothetical protein
MGYELERRSLVTRSVERQLTAHEARSLIDQARIAADESSATFYAERCISNAYALAEHTMFRAARLNAIVSDLGRDNPSLEMAGRRLEAACELGAAEFIHRYITRR